MDEALVNALSVHGPLAILLGMFMYWQIRGVKQETKPNGGSSLRDAVDANGKDIALLSAQFAAISQRLADGDKRMDGLSTDLHEVRDWVHDCKTGS